MYYKESELNNAPSFFVFSCSPDYTEHYNTMPFGMKKIKFIKC